MSWSTPRDWTAGEVVTGALLDAQLRDNLDWLYATRPIYIGHLGGIDATAISTSYQDSTVRRDGADVAGRLVIPDYGAMADLGISPQFRVSVYTQTGSSVTHTGAIRAWTIAEDSYESAATGGPSSEFCEANVTETGGFASAYGWSAWENVPSLTQDDGLLLGGRCKSSSAASGWIFEIGVWLRWVNTP